MWQCPACEYWNDEPAQRCERCQAERDEDPLQPVAEPGPPARFPQLDVFAGEEGGRRRWSALERAALAVIVACLLLLIGFAFCAWRGWIKLPSGGGAGGAGQAATATGTAGSTAAATSGAAQGTAATPEAAQAGDPLAAIYTDKQRGLRSLRPYADALQEYEEQVAQLEVPEFPGGRMSTDTADYLTRLHDLGQKLVASYQAFAEEQPRLEEPGLQDYLDLLNTAYAADFKDVLGRIGEVYSKDDYGQHSAYGLSDIIADAVEQVDADQAEDLRALWLTYVDGRKQYQLDQAQVEEHRRLSALLSALNEVHVKFQQSLNQLPPYSAPNGLLDHAGSDTLELLEALATNIETLVGEYEDYAATLDVVKLSRANRDLLDRFKELTQQDHLYAFTEVYRIYTQDRRLEDPAYARLEEHFDFAKQHWPEMEMSYRRVYTAAEDEWARVWNK